MGRIGTTSEVGLVELPCLLVVKEDALKGERTVRHLFHLAFQVAKSGAYPLQGGEATLDAVGADAGCLQKSAQLIRGIVQEACVGDDGKPLFVGLIFGHGMLSF